MTISSIKDDIGLCVQTGNICRAYTDMIKLQYLFENKKINSAIVIVPTKKFAWEIYRTGGSLTTFEKFTTDITLFKDVIKIPITVIGF